MSQRTTISSGGAFEEVFGYSRAVRVGNHLHISGTCPRLRMKKTIPTYKPKPFLKLWLRLSHRRVCNCRCCAHDSYRSESQES